MKIRKVVHSKSSVFQWTSWKSNGPTLETLSVEVHHNTSIDTYVLLACYSLWFCVGCMWWLTLGPIQMQVLLRGYIRWLTLCAIHTQVFLHLEVQFRVVPVVSACIRCECAHFSKHKTTNTSSVTIRSKKHSMAVCTIGDRRRDAKIASSYFQWTVMGCDTDQNPHTCTDVHRQAKSRWKK